MKEAAIKDPTSLISYNLSSLLRRLGSFRAARFFTADGLVLYDGGTDSAYENYALLLPGALPPVEVEAAVRRGLDFFSGTSRPHIWPLFPSFPDAAARLLTDAGAREDDAFCGMVADLAALKCVDVSEDAYLLNEDRSASFTDIADWADAAWLGFDSGEPAPGSFISFVREMAESPDILLYALRARNEATEKSEIAATGMLHVSADTAGIYYVAAQPQFRGKGLASLIVKSLMAKARVLGYDHACLMATPAGRPLYLRNGFRETGEIRILAFGE